MYWADNVITPPLSVSSIRSVSLCVWAGVPSCQVSAFLWSGQLTDRPGSSEQLPLAIAGIFQISVKTRQIKSETARLIRREPELMTERSGAQQLYSDQSCSNDIFTMFPTVQACIWSYSAVQCFALCVNESVYPSSLLSFNCCSKNKHEQASTQQSSGSQRHAPWSLSPPSLVSALPRNHNIMKMKCVRRELSKWCNEGRWEQRLRWKIILQCTAALPWIRLIQLQICLCRSPVRSAHILRAQQTTRAFSRLHFPRNIFRNFRRRPTFILWGEDLSISRFLTNWQTGVIRPDLNIVVSKYPAYNRIQSPV